MLDLKIYKTNHGLTGLWEQGGNGNTVIVADDFGRPTKPFAVRRKGDNVNSLHALMPLKVGYLYAVYNGKAVILHRVDKINEDLSYDYTVVGMFNKRGKELSPPSIMIGKSIQDMVKAAISKGEEEECSLPYYNKEVVK